MRQGRLQLDLSLRTTGPVPRFLFRLLAAGVLALCVAAPVRVQADPDGPARFEAEPVLRAADLVAPSLLSGPGWLVDSEVPVRGYQARFTIRSRWGALQADSIELLAVRVAEMPAVERLHRAGVTRVVLESAEARAGEPVEAMSAIAHDPTRTMTGLPGGIARYFSERWQKLRTQARRLGDRGHDLVLESGSPYDDAGGPLGAAADERPDRKRSWARKRGRDVMREVENEVSLPGARRSLAARLGVDPGTRNPLIAPRLDALAWAEASGRFAAGEVLSLLGADAVDVMSQAVQVNRLVLEEAPEQVRVRNQQRLAQHCLDERLLRAFIREKAYSASLQSDFTDLFVGMHAASGCEALLETALMAGDEAQGRFIVNALRLLAHQLGDEAAGGRFVPQGALLAYETTSGEFVLPLAVDWLAWTDEMARWFALPAIDRRPQRTLLVSGGISERAARELTARGWSLVERVPYDGAPSRLDPSRYAGSAVTTPAVHSDD